MSLPISFQVRFCSAAQSGTTDNLVYRDPVVFSLHTTGEHPPFQSSVEQFRYFCMPFYVCIELTGAFGAMSGRNGLPAKASSMDSCIL